MIGNFLEKWVYGGFLAGLAILSCAPLMADLMSPLEFWCFILLPVYMLHQFEEHGEDRFRTYVNTHVCRGAEGITPLMVFIINVPGVWGVIVIALLLAYFVNGGLALIATYLVLVNAVAHIADAAFTRAYNPGLVTAIILFVPFGLLSFESVQQAGDGTLLMHGIGLGSAVLIHLAIVIAVLARTRRLTAASQG